MGWLERRARWTRTWQNKDQGQGDLVLNTPDGWVIEDPYLHWQGSDNLRTLLMETGGGGRGLGLGDYWGERGAEAHASTHGFPAITRATGLIVDTLAGVDWEVKRGRETLPTPRWMADPALARPDLRVSDYRAEGVGPLSMVAFRAETLTSALWYGDAFVWVPARDEQGQPIPPLFHLHPSAVAVVTPALTCDRWPLPGYWVEVGHGEWQRLGADEVIHVRGMPPYWNGRGRGALTSHLGSWEEALAQRNYASGLFTAGIPAGYLKVTAPNLTEEQAEALKSKWTGSHGGGMRRSIAVLNAVTEFHPIQMPPEQAQMVESKRMGILDVANAFGVEPYMLGLPADGSTYANIESRMRHFIQFTLLPWARRVEGALDNEFPQGTGVRLNLNDLARGDSAQRVAYFQAGLAGGWLTTDEIRAAEGFPPLPADVRQETPPQEEAPNGTQ